MERTQLLQQIVYSLVCLRAKAQHLHWNFVYSDGGRFSGIHELADKVIGNTAEFIDWTAETIRRYAVPVDASLNNATIFGTIAIPTGVTASMEDVSALSSAIKEVVDYCHGCIPALNPSEQSSLTAYTDKLLSNAMWLDREAGK